MKIFLKLPYIPIPLEERSKIFENERELRILSAMPPLGENAEIREIEYYLDKDRISYIVRDWEADKKRIVKTECYFAKDLK